MVVLRGDHVLLIKRGKPPNEGRWALPGGAQELGETAEQTARRELLEETGIEAGPLTLAATVDSIHRDPDGKIQYHYTIIDFAAHWSAGEPAGGSDTLAAVWAHFDELDDYDLWTEAHRVINAARAVLAGSAASAGVGQHGPR